MNTAAIDALPPVLAAVDPRGCDRTGLAALVAACQRVRGALDALEARIAGAASDVAEPAVVVLLDEGRRSGKDAQAAADRGVACHLLAGLHDALATGEVSAGHVDAVARTAKHLDDEATDELRQLAAPILDAARTSTVAVFERQMRDLGRLLSRDDGVGHHERLRRQRSLRRWVDHQTGMHHTHVLLHPEADARLSVALDAAVAAERAKPELEERTLEQLRADAFVDLVAGNGGGQRRPPGIAVLVDLETLRGGLHDRSVCETADGHDLPPAAVRRMACDAELIPVVLDGKGVTLDVGRAQRMATPAQRVALRAMYRSCAHPHCTVRFADCEIHHVIEWHPDGRTDLANLLPLCSQHHHLVHEGGWALTLHPDRTVHLRRPDGTTAFNAPTTIARARAPAA